MEQYQRDLNQDLDVNEFWNEFGYSGRHAHYPSNDAQFLKKRLQRIKPLMQCVLCGKWRQLRFHPKLINDPPNPDTWTCEMNTDNTKQKLGGNIIVFVYDLLHISLMTKFFNFLSCNEPEEFDPIRSSEYVKQKETNFDEIAVEDNF